MNKITGRDDESRAVARRRYQATRLRRLCGLCSEMLIVAGDDMMAGHAIARLCADLEVSAAVAESMVDSGMPWGRVA